MISKEFCDSLKLGDFIYVTEKGVTEKYNFRSSFGRSDNAFGYSFVSEKGFNFNILFSIDWNVPEISKEPHYEGQQQYYTHRKIIPNIVFN